jgi:hypothetical protein
MLRMLGLFLLILPAACTVPFVPQPPGPWSGFPEPNEWNLHVMVANPQDLSNGEAANVELAHEAAPPVRRLYAGQRTPLMNVTAEVFGAASAPAAAQGGTGAGQQ